jgi:hypothetical protein
MNLLRTAYCVEAPHAATVNPGLRLARSGSAAIERWRTNCPNRGRMSDHSHAAHPPMRAETPEAFLADRQRFWSSFTHFTLGSVIFIIVLLVLMAIFLL